MKELVQLWHWKILKATEQLQFHCSVQKHRCRDHKAGVSVLHIPQGLLLPWLRLWGWKNFRWEEGRPRNDEGMTVWSATMWLHQPTPFHNRLQEQQPPKSILGKDLWLTPVHSPFTQAEQREQGLPAVYCIHNSIQDAAESFLLTLVFYLNT